MPKVKILSETHCQLEKGCPFDEILPASVTPVKEGEENNGIEEIRNSFGDIEEIKAIYGMIHGLYEIYWKSGGSSLASVGYEIDGKNWFAPTNWLSGSTNDWTMVKAYKMLIPNDYHKKTKSIKSDHPKIFINHE